MCDKCVVDDEMEFCEECPLIMEGDNADNERKDSKRREDTDLRP